MLGGELEQMGQAGIGESGEWEKLAAFWLGAQEGWEQRAGLESQWVRRFWCCLVAESPGALGGPEVGGRAQEAGVGEQEE